MKISQSEVSCFRNCQKRHDFRYNLSLVPKNTVGNAAFRGTALHLGLEVFFKHIQEHGWKAYHEATKLAEQELIMKMGADIFNAKWYSEALMILKNYFEYYTTDIGKYNIVSVEDEFEFKITETLKMGLRIDLIVEYLTGPLKGQIILRDYKSTYDFWSDHKQKFNVQFPLYTFVLNKLFNYDMEYMELEQLRTRKLKDPRFNDLFQRTTLHFGESQQAQMWEEFVATAQEIRMRRLNPELSPLPVRNPDYEWCKNCEYERPCELQMYGRDRDAESWIELEYTTRDSYSYGEKF